MLFRKKIERSCTYCVHGACIGENQILCAKKGLRTVESSCRKFQYDPCKRIPVKARALDFTKYKTEDFSM